MPAHYYRPTWPIQEAYTGILWRGFRFLWATAQYIEVYRDEEEGGGNECGLIRDSIGVVLVPRHQSIL